MRGEAGSIIVLAPPTYMGCDGRIAEPVGSRMVVATGDRFFGAAPQTAMHPYWRVDPAGGVTASGVVDADLEHRTLDGLIRALSRPDRPAILVTPAPVGELAEPVRPVASVPAWAPIVAIGLLTIGLFGAVVWAGRRPTAGR